MIYHQCIWKELRESILPCVIPFALQSEARGVHTLNSHNGHQIYKFLKILFMLLQCMRD